MVYCVRDDGLTSYLGFTDSVLLLQLLWKKIVLIRRGRRVGLGTTARYLYYCLLSSVQLHFIGSEVDRMDFLACCL